MASSESTYDYIIIGGGTAGCVLASRLLERKRSLAVLVIEAGSDGSKHPHVSKPLEAALLPFSDMDFKYSTVPQKHLDGKPRYVGGAVAITAGKAERHTCGAATPSTPATTHDLMFKYRRLDPRRRSRL